MGSRPKLDRLYYPLSQVSDLLHIPTADLIEQAVLGNLQLFVPVPENTKVWSVHRDAIDITSLRHRYKLLTGDARQVETSETYPVNMEAGEIEGLVLSHDECIELRQQGFTTTTTFTSGIKSQITTTCEVAPLPRNRFYKNRKFDYSSWVLACYPTDSLLHFQPGLGYPIPHQIRVTPEQTWTTRGSVENLLNEIHFGRIAKEYFNYDRKTGAIIGVKAKEINKLPNRLRTLLKVASSTWKDCRLDASSVNIQAKKAELKKELNTGPFSELFPTRPPAKGTIARAIDFTTPFFAQPKSKVLNRDYFPAYVTQNMVALVVAWKILWSRPDIDISKTETYPTPDSERAFLNTLGFTTEEAKVASTLIKPNAMKPGRRKKEPKSLRDKFLISRPRN